MHYARSTIISIPALIFRLAFLLAIITATSGTASAQETATQAPPAIHQVLTSPREGKVSRAGFELHYRVIGESGPYLLLLSGGPGANVGYMQPIADELSKTHQCIMLEQRGTGRSTLKTYDASTITWPAYLADIEALRQQLKINKLILVGNSWGMMLALSYGAAYPNFVSAIITLGSGPITTNYANVFKRNVLRQLSATEIATFQHWSVPAHVAEDSQRARYECVRAIMPGYFYNRRTALKFIKGIRKEDSNSRVLPVFEGEMRSYDLRPQLKMIVAPVLLLQGREDCAGEANIGEAHLLIKGSILTFVEQCGHMPWVEQPEQSWQIINEFLKNLPSIHDTEASSPKLH